MAGSFRCSSYMWKGGDFEGRVLLSYEMSKWKLGAYCLMILW